ncbi:MAG: DUF1818 family protein [Phormidesmis sp.]
MIRHIKSGDGWRLGWNPSAEQFKGLVAGAGWAIELSAAEFSDFCRISQQLASTMAAMSQQLMAEERLTCEQETRLLWMEAEGFPDKYSLRFILLTGRGGEGEWPAETVVELLSALSQPPFAQLQP